MEALIYTRKYSDKAGFKGSLVVEVTDAFGYTSWRRCVSEGDAATECDILLLQYKSKYVFKRYVLKVVSQSGREPRVYMRLDLNEVRRYHAITDLWHEVELKGGRKFAILLDGGCHHRSLMGQLRKALKSKLIEESQHNGQELYSRLKFGLAITVEEADKYIMNEFTVFDNVVTSAPTQNVYDVPLPRAQDRQVSRLRHQATIGDLMRSLRGPIADDKDIDLQVVDEVDEAADVVSTHSDLCEELRDAIAFGDSKRASEIAVSLAEQKQRISVISNEDDPLYADMRIFHPPPSPQPDPKPVIQAPPTVPPRPRPRSTRKPVAVPEKPYKPPKPSDTQTTPQPVELRTKPRNKPTPSDFEEHWQCWECTTLNPFSEHQCSLCDKVRSDT